MKVDKAWLRKALQDISMYGQIGFTIVVPPVVLCLIANWLMKRFHIGHWLLIAAIILGILCAFTSIYKICCGFLLKNTKEKDENRKISYRKHS